jgi:hypothetical protein
MPKWMKVAAICLAAALALGIVARFALRRGPSGATAEFGGSLPAKEIPEFPSLDASRWVNGAPTSLASLRGEVVILEAWHPA